MLTIGSLFSGIGGLELGLERAGLGPVRWQVEIDPYCRRVLAKHWPDAKRFEDVTKVGSEIEPVDIICGGFPCQDISVAGKGAGLEGERSGLWREFARIVGVVRPRYVVVENVSALLARGLGDVLGDLAALGYDAQWDCIPATAIGAPHQRDRLFLVAWSVSDTERDGGREQPERDQTRSAERWDSHVAHVRKAVANGNGRRQRGERVEDWQSAIESARRDQLDRCSRPQLADTDKERRRQSGPESEAWEWIAEDWSDDPWPPLPDDVHAWRGVPPFAQPGVCRVANGIPSRVDRLRALGNAVVPQVAEVIGRVIAERML